MSNANWTINQKRAIESRGKNLLVSAGAGSGKTTVMIARIVDLMVKNRVPISNFLVVTFTKASASDMKNKLIRELEKLPLDNFLLEQIEEVGTSDVSNLHSFCARLLKIYFYKIGLDPSFVVLDEVEMSALKQKAMGKLFDECLNNGDNEMLELADILNKNRSEIGLSEAIITLREFLLSQIDGQSWLNDCITKCYEPNLNENICAKFLNKQAVEIFKSAYCEFDNLISIARQYNDEKLINFIENAKYICAMISGNSSVVSNFSNLMELPSFGRLPLKVCPEHEDVKTRVAEVRDNLNKQIKNIKQWWGEEDLNKISLHLQENKHRVQVLNRLAIRFDEILTELKNAKGGLDFSDLEKYTLKVLEIEEVQNALKQKYKFIFVDEYQDINPVQERILTLLANEDNRFMVGDIKQSIYRFRLCEPEIFLEKYKKYGQNETGAEEVIDLQENFRSNDKILQFCNFVFSRIYTKDFGGIDYNPEGLLKCGTSEWDNPNGFPAVDFVFLETAPLKESLKPKKAEDELPLYSVAKTQAELEEEGSVAYAEAGVIARKIQELVGSKIYAKEGEPQKKLRFRDMVVLIASRGTYLENFVKALSSFGIPVSSDLSQDVFEDEYILSLLNLLQVIDNFAQDYPLANLMKSPIYNFSLNELAEIKIANPDSKYYYQAVLSAINNQNLNTALMKKLNKFYSEIMKFKSLSGFMPAKELVNRIIDETGFELLLPGSCDAQASSQKLARFKQTLTTSSLSSYLEDVKNSKITCETVPEGDSVRVMTIHSSKGLEFPVVFLANCGKEFSNKSGLGDLLISKDLGVGLKYYNSELRYKCENFVRSAIRMNEAYKIKEEQLRLLYVALTRAVNHLIIVGSGECEEICNNKPAYLANSFLEWFSPCINEKLYGTDSLKDIARIEIGDALSESKTQFHENVRQVIFNSPNNSLLDEIKQVCFSEPKYKKLTEFPSKTSVTVLNSQENTAVPVLFNEEGEGYSPELGTAYHKVLEKIDFSNCTSEKIDEIIANLISLKVIDSNLAEKIDKEPILKLVQNEIIQNNLDGKFFKEKEFFMAVTPLENMCENNGDFMVVQGICDLVILKNNKLILIDFKLSKKNAEKLKQTYFEQIELYSNALENSFNLPVSEKYICKINTGEFIKI